MENKEEITLKSLNKKIKNIEGEIEFLKEDELENIKDNIDDLETILEEELKYGLQDLEDKTDEIEGRIDDNEDYIKDLEIRIENLEKENNELKELLFKVLNKLTDDYIQTQNSELEEFEDNEFLEEQQKTKQTNKQHLKYISPKLK